MASQLPPWFLGNDLGTNPNPAQNFTPMVARALAGGFRKAPEATQPDTANYPAVVGDPRGKVLPRDINSMPFSPEADLSDKQQLLEMLKKQQAGSDTLQGLADKYKKLMDSQGKGDMGGLLALADSAFGSNTLQAAHAIGAVKPKLSEEEKIGNLAKIQEMVDKSRTPISQEMLRLYGGEANNLQRALSSQVNQVNKSNKDTQKNIDNYNKAMDLTVRNSPPALQEPLKKLNRITQMTALMDSIDQKYQGKATPNEFANVSTALAGVVTNNNIIAENTIKHVMPSMSGNTGAEIAQWFTNKPYGVEQQEWFKRFRNEAAAEQLGAKRIINGWTKTQHSAAVGQVPDEYRNQKYQAAQEFLSSAYPDISVPDGGKPVSQAEWNKYKSQNVGPGKAYKTEQDAAAYLKGQGHVPPGY